MFEQAFFPTASIRASRPQSAVSRSDWPRRLDLAQFIDLHRSTPSQILGLGTCEDGLPVFFDLRDPRPGALLVIGDPGSGKTDLLRTLLASGFAWNSPLELNYAVISAHPQDFTFDGKESRYFRGAWDPQSPETPAEIIRLAELAEERLNHHTVDSTAIVLVLDDLTFLPGLESDARLNLEWLIQNGPTAGIWPIASLRTADALSMSRAAHYFGTHLLGKMSRSAAHRLAYGAAFNTDALIPGRQFAVQLNRTFLKFWLPVDHS